MVSVNGLVHSGNKTRALLSSSAEDRPLGVQLFGDDPQLLAQAAEMVEDQADLIDINMGCPVRKVVAGGAGAALMMAPDRIRSIIQAVRAVTRLPLTIKIRSGWQVGDNTWQEVGRIAEGEGVDAIALHPRSRSQMFTGSADWSQLAQLKQIVKIPVIGSGDLFTPQDCLNMLQETGCDGLMIARGCLGSPWIFQQTRQLLQQQAAETITARYRASVAEQHLLLFIDDAGPKLAVREMKKHLGWYIHGITGAAAMRREANSATDCEQLLQIIRRMADSEIEE
jgi:nifR3 family TIM-barrel protein